MGKWIVEKSVSGWGVFVEELKMSLIGGMEKMMSGK